MAQYINQLYAPLFSTPKDLCNEELTEFIGHKDEVNCVSYSSDFRLFVYGSQIIHVVVRTSESTEVDLKLKKLQTMRETLSSKVEVNCVSYSSDFQFMVTGSDDERVRVFKVKTKQCLIKLKGHEGAIRSVAVSPCDKYFASGSYDKTARVWRTANGQCLHTLIGHTKSVEKVAFSPGSIYLCTASWDRTAILWNLEAGCMVKRFEGHQHAVQAVAFSYSFLLVATGSWDFTVRVWRMNQTEYKKALREQTRRNENEAREEDINEDCNYSEKKERINEENDSHNKFKEKTVPPNTDIINTDDDDLKENDANDDDDGDNNTDEKCVSDTENNDNDNTSSKDGKMDDGEKDARESPCPKDVDMFDENGCLVLKGHVGNVHTVAFSRFGMLASGSWDRTVRLWNPNNGWCLRLLVGHEGWVKAVTFSPDSTYVASAADDDSVKVWDIPSGKCVKSFEASTDLAQHCAFTPDGVLVASGAAVMEQKAPLKKDRQEEEEEVESLLKSKPPRGILKSASSVRKDQPSRASCI